MQDIFYAPPAPCPALGLVRARLPGPYRVLLVCRANLCRSHMALAITAQLLQQMALHEAIELGSAGTHALARRRPPDPRALATLLHHGYPAPIPCTRSVVAEDFGHFDQVLAMDHENLADLQARCPPAHGHKLRLFLHGAAWLHEREVPDPYFGAMAGFERVLRLCEAGARGLVALWQAGEYDTAFSPGATAQPGLASGVQTGNTAAAWPPQPTSPRNLPSGI